MKPSRPLDPQQIARLKAFAQKYRLSQPALLTKMGLPMTLTTFSKAMKGRRIWEFHYDFLAQWIEENTEPVPATKSTDR